ncbi:MAG: flagellar basal body P-ring formation chaperone FlgA [Hyphomonadaceae bacterium]
MMLRAFTALFAIFALAGAAFADAPALRLRDNIVVSGPAITLGDIFENAGEAGARAVALSPPPGQSGAFSAQYMANAALAAGLAWAPPQGMTQIIISRAGQDARFQRTAASVMRAADGAREAAVRRGDTITLAFTAPGLELTTRARALSDGAVGQTIRAVNLQSNREIDVTITAAGAASVSPR